MTGNGTFQTSRITAKVTLPETAVGAPCACNINDATLVIGWTGTDPQHHLNVETSADARNFPALSKVTLNETSFDGPALAFGNGKLFLAWVGTDPNSSLNVAISTDGGATFPQKVTFGESGASAPGLAS